MTSASLLVHCPKCGQKFRIARSPGPVHITCPKCATQWDWRPSGSSDQAARERMRQFWRAAVLRPRLSYAGAAAVLLAGLGLGACLVHYERGSVSEDLTLPDALTNPPPVVQPAKSSPAIRPGAAAGAPLTEAVLPTNGVDFEPAPVGPDLAPVK